MPQFEQSMYTVPENDRTVPLCIDIGVQITESLTYTITAVQKSPPEAEGKLLVLIHIYTIFACNEMSKELCIYIMAIFQLSPQ